MFHSIKSRFLALTLIPLLIMGLTMSLVGLRSLTQATDEHEVDNMNRIAENYRETINLKLNKTEDIVTLAANGIRTQAIAGHTEEDQDRSDLMENLRLIMQQSIADIPEARSFYAFFAGQSASSDQSFWLVRPNESSVFSRQQLYNVRDYLPGGKDAGDRSMDWLSIPLRSHRGCWAKPYYSDTQQAYLISYVIPVYDEHHELLAVVGADLDFGSIMSSIAAQPVYQTGFVYLMDATGETHYHPDALGGEPYNHEGTQLIQGPSVLDKQARTDQLIRYDYKNISYDAAFTPLRNGLALIVTAPTSEVHARTQRAGATLIALLLGILLLTALLTLAVARRLSRSLRLLSLNALRVAHGNLYVRIAMDGDDEIGKLSQSFQRTIDSLRMTLARMNRMTYHDGLTDILNRLGTDNALERWINAASKTLEPAIIISLDLDNFKSINDQFGHAAGDEALKSLANRIENFFTRHNSRAIVGRNGGDEFMVLLPGTTPEQVDEWLAELTSSPQHYSYNNINHEFTLSMGYVIYPEQGDNLRTLLRHADHALYTTKLRGKNGFSRYDPATDEKEQEKTSSAKASPKADETTGAEGKTENTGAESNTSGNAASEVTGKATAETSAPADDGKTSKTTEAEGQTTDNAASEGTGKATVEASAPADDSKTSETIEAEGQTTDNAASEGTGKATVEASAPADDSKTSETIEAEGQTTDNAASEGTGKTGEEAPAPSVQPQRKQRNKKRKGRTNRRKKT